MSRGDDLLTAEQVAEWLQVTTATLKRWRHTRTGPLAMSLGRKVRYRRGDVEDYIERRRRAAVNQRTTLRGIA